MRSRRFATCGWFVISEKTYELIVGVKESDDVYIDVERREEERKKQGLPSRLGVLPHSTVAEEERRWEAEQESKKKRPKSRRK